MPHSTRLTWDQFAELYGQLQPLNLIAQLRADGTAVAHDRDTGRPVARLAPRSADPAPDLPTVTIDDDSIAPITSPHWRVASLAVHLTGRLVDRPLTVKGCPTSRRLNDAMDAAAGAAATGPIAITLAASGEARGTIELATAASPDGIVATWSIDAEVDQQATPFERPDPTSLQAEGRLRIGPPDTALPSIDPYELALRRSVVAAAATLCKHGGSNCPAPRLQLVHRHIEVPQLSIPDTPAALTGEAA